MTELGHCDDFMFLVKHMYSNKQFVDNLKTIKNKMKDVHKSSHPQYDDIEAEITCLLIMFYKTKLIYEFSPCGGWSTLYMLNTLKQSELDKDAAIHSFDIQDICSTNISQFPDLKPMWNFHLGNVCDKYGDFPVDIDYLFIDSDHSANFANIYIENLLVPLLQKCKQQNKKIVVSVHDVFHSRYPSDEGKAVIEFLLQNQIPYFSPNNIHHKKIIDDIRKENKLDKELVHHATSNPAIFFILG